MESPEQIRDRLLARFPGVEISIVTNPGPAAQHSLLLGASHATEIAFFLRDDPALRLDYCSNVTGVDWPDREITETIRRALPPLEGASPSVRRDEGKSPTAATARRPPIADTLEGAALSAPFRVGAASEMHSAPDIPGPPAATSPAGAAAQPKIIEEKIKRLIPGHLEVIYHLYSMALKHGPVILRLRTGNRTDRVALPSLTPVWRACEFQEREVYDLFGVVFTGHPDLRRILMWDEFKDHPMRKDYVEPDDYEWEPTPHDDVRTKAKAHYPAPPATAGGTP